MFSDFSPIFKYMSVISRKFLFHKNFLLITLMYFFCGVGWKMATRIMRCACSIIALKNSTNFHVCRIVLRENLFRRPLMAWFAMLLAHLLILFLVIAVPIRGAQRYRVLMRRIARPPGMRASFYVK